LRIGEQFNNVPKTHEITTDASGGDPHTSGSPRGGLDQPTEDGPSRGKPRRGLLLIPHDDCLKELDTFRLTIKFTEILLYNT
jgi:hypothetical protein